MQGAAGQLLAAVVSNEIDATEKHIEAGGDPNIICHRPHKFCSCSTSSMAAVGTRLPCINGEFTAVFITQGSSVLSLACYLGSVELIALLTASGANLEHIDTVR